MDALMCLGDVSRPFILQNADEVQRLGILDDGLDGVRDLGLDLTLPLLIDSPALLRDYLRNGGTGLIRPRRFG